MGEPEASATQQWTNESVLKFAGDADPVQAVIHAAREVALRAMDAGWAGPPYDPIRLAAIRGFGVSPRADIPDARTVPSGAGRFLIEYNPTRPAARLRYSIAHEIAHTLFPDCAARIRNRGGSHAGGGDDWQLETLCNIGAAELLMPLGSGSAEAAALLDIDKVSEARKRFEVSTEAVLIRLAHLSNEACAAFVASRKAGAPGGESYTFDYVIPSRSWGFEIRRGARLPKGSAVAECTAIGFTAKGETTFPGIHDRFRTECIGIPPYPGSTFPRVAGFMSHRGRSASVSNIKYLQGNVLAPRGSGPKMIVHVVSDATPNWGGTGVAVAIRRKWPNVQEHFRIWAAEHGQLKLGNAHFCTAQEGVQVASLLCQHGYGDSSKPRLRYAALESALSRVTVHAKAVGASLHLPRIGCGQAGGSWPLVEEIIGATLLDAKIPVTVYDLPDAPPQAGPRQMSLVAAS